MNDNRPAHKTSVLRFFLLFLLFNILLFIPFLLFFPEQWPSLQDLTGWEAEHIYQQHTSFPIRFSTEIILCFLVYTLLPAKMTSLKKGIVWISFTLFSLFFLYQVYYFFYWKIYAEYPYFLNDFMLMRDVVPIFLSSIGLGNSLVTLLALSLIGVLLYLMFRLNGHLFAILGRLPSYEWVQVLLLFLLFLGFVSFWKHESRSFSINYSHVQTISQKVAHSSLLPDARKYRKVENTEPYQAYLEQDLREKPDIYAIFVESYGAVAPLSPGTASHFDSLYSVLETHLAEDSWGIRSAYSDSPILGGRSWLAFTTALSGIEVKNHVQYNDLIKNNPDYPHLVRFLEKQGYNTMRIGTMRSTQKTDSLVPYAVTNLYWQYDRIFTYRDIPYKGYAYDPFGGIPDQYALHYVYEQNVQNVQLPSFLFFITMNSHGPWYPPPPVASNWKMLDTIRESPYPDGQSLEDPLLDRYARSITYELEMLTDFILQAGDENDIFILMGDHQAPMLEHTLYNIYSKHAVPVHVIARDTSFLQGFDQAGFVESLDLDAGTAPLIMHAGFYSYFMQALLHRYGEEGVATTKIYPGGIQ